MELLFYFNHLSNFVQFLTFRVKTQKEISTNYQMIPFHTVKLQRKKNWMLLRLFFSLDWMVITDYSCSPVAWE